MSLVLRSGSLTFSDVPSMRAALDRTISDFVSIVKIKIIQYLQLNDNVPKDTGLMSNTAQLSTAQSAAVPDFDVQIVFDTEYAIYVHRKGEQVHFLPVVEEEITDLFYQTLEEVFSGSGWGATITR